MRILILWGQFCYSADLAEANLGHRKDGHFFSLSEHSKSLEIETNLVKFMFSFCFFSANYLFTKKPRNFYFSHIET